MCFETNEEGGKNTDALQDFREWVRKVNGRVELTV